MKKLLFAIYIILLLSVNAHAQTGTPPANQFTADDLIADTRFFKAALEEVHPSLYKYIPKDTLNSLFNTAINRLSAPVTVKDFRIMLQKILSRVGSGHTYFHPNPSVYNPKLHFYFPFLVVVRNQKLYIYKSFNAVYDIYAGYEIGSVQGEPAKNILANVYSYLSGEGLSNTYKDFKIEKTMTFTNAMDELYGFRTNYLIKLQKDQSAPIEKTFAATFYRKTDTTFISYLLPSYKSPEQMRTISYPDSIANTAILAIKSFAYNDREAYINFYASTFSQLKSRKIKNLIVDLRGNTGGATFGAVELLRYLLNKNFKVVDDYHARVAMPSFKQHIAPKDQELLTTVPFTAREKGGYTFSNMASTKIAPNQDLNFKGRIYLLTDGGTYSVASMFASCLKANAQVTVIGSETGGSATALDVSPFLTVRLPRTGLTFNLPQVYVTLANSGKSKSLGVTADVEVKPTPYQVYMKNDAVMSRVKQLIDAGK